ncbi:MAG: GNAT family N-acetyltransferase [Pyrinomonadaceae bacterium]|nr:GNAT family N-acetyltransferase [Pyrinomonadaceae bacterium]
MLVHPVTLEGRSVRLEPLSLSHLADLGEVAFDEEIWRYTTSVIEKPEDLREYVETALQWQEEGIALPFATVDKQSGRAVGSTRYAAIDGANRRLEIGWTWIGREFQRTYVNTEAKCLMLAHAFEKLNCMRVEFKTDSLNEKSRRALLRIGAKEEGTFRNHMIMPSGRIRHSVYYSIIDTEWPEVKSALEEKLKRIEVRG